jgi:hypothetical protein
LLAVVMQSCSVREYNEVPDLESLRQGIRTSAAIGYCASIAVSAHKGLPLPSNVETGAGPGLLSVRIDDQHPLPFNRVKGNILIASLWNEQGGGLMSVLFARMDQSESDFEIYGFWAVPLAEDPSGYIKAVYADQDIIIGNGSDTIIDLTSMTSLFMNSRLNLLETDAPDDPFVAVKQNLWFVKISQKGTYNVVLDDDIEVSGGGQIAEVVEESGGVAYHALIEARMNYLKCSRNPVSGYALSQNFKAGGEPLIDLGNSLLLFHSSCDGKAHVEISTGKYSGFSNKDITLGL